MSIWKMDLDLEALKDLHDDTIVTTLGIEVTERGDDYLKGRMPVDERTHQPYGILHGGASVVLAESLGSLASSMCVDLSTHFVVGLEVNANHLRPVHSGYVTGIVTPTHLGRTIHVWEIKLYNDDNKLTCTSRLTVAVRERVEA